MLLTGRSYQLVTTDQTEGTTCEVFRNLTGGSLLFEILKI